MLRKILLSGVIIAAVYILSIGAFAAPERISQDYKGNSDNLIRVTNPRNNFSTTKGNVAITIIGNEGTAVTFYSPDIDSNEYFAIDTDIQSTRKIGASGLYLTTLSLENGVNIIGIYADQSGRDQFIVRRVTKLSGSIKNSIGSILIRDIKDVFRVMH